LLQTQDKRQSPSAGAAPSNGAGAAPPGRHGTTAGQIILIDFSRNPKTLRDVLRECATFASCCHQQLPDSGGHVIVRPEVLRDALAAIEREGWALKRRHLVVAEEAEELVMRCIRERLASKEQVRPRSRTVASLAAAAPAREQPAAPDPECDRSVEQSSAHAPLGAAGRPGSENGGGFGRHSAEAMSGGAGRRCLLAEPLEGDSGGGRLSEAQADGEMLGGGPSERFELFVQFCVKRTFIHVQCASPSVYSGPSSGPKTVSTSDGNPRISVRPRRT